MYGEMLVRGFNTSAPIDVPLDKQYPGGEPIVKGGWWNKEIREIILRPKSLQSFVTAMFTIDGLIERGHKAPRLILPYIPGARQDRVNDDGDFLFTLKSVAKMINDRGFPSVTVYDAHSDVALALIDRCYNVKAVDILPGSLGYSGIVAPDAGASKRAGEVAVRHGFKLVQAWKKRDIATGAIAGFGYDASSVESNESFLVVDDICDGGGTFIGLAQAMQNNPANEFKPTAINLDLYVTHGIFSKGTDELLKYYRNIYTTDSILGTPHNVEIIHNIV